MREVDMKIPFASDIRKFHDSNWTVRELKKMEIQIAENFEWNIGFITFLNPKKNLKFKNKNDKFRFFFFHPNIVWQ